MRQIVGLEESGEFCIGRVDNFDDGLFCRRLQPGLLGSRDGGRHPLERFVETALRWILADGTLNFCGHTLHYDARLGDAAVYGLLQALGEGLHVGAEGLHPREPVPVIGQGVEAQLLDGTGQQLRPPQLGDRPLVAVVQPGTGQVVTQLISEQAVVEPLGRA